MKDRTLPDHGPTPPAEDPLDRTLAAVRALIESTVTEHRARRTRSRQVIEIGVEDAAIRAAAEQVAEEARHTVDIALPAASPAMTAVHTALAELVAGLGDEIEVRVLCSDPSAAWGARGEVRTARVPLPTLVIADGGSALVCTESAAGRQTSVASDPVVVRTMCSMFQSIWASATPVAWPFDFGNRARADMVRRVLERLRDGVTDEAAARELAISVRTYRRYVTGILELLDADSRFQAGVRAMELGILRDK